MANYQLLKADIDAKVYENAYREITGEKLNSVLNAMVTTLGAEYQFAGVATTDTNPGTPDAKVFYIANGKGTYANFGNIEVTEDEVVVLTWDSSWHKVATGIASNEKLSELEKEIDNIPIEKGTGENSIIQSSRNGAENKSISENSVALGSLNIAGTKAYKWSAINFDTKTIILVDTPSGISTGDRLSIINKNRYYDCCEVVSVSGKNIVVDSLPFTAILDDSGEDAQTIFVVSKPDVGNVDAGQCAFAEGCNTMATQMFSHAEGYGTKAIGKYSHTEGKQNEAHYCAHAEGSNNKSTGNTSHTEGTDNIASNSNAHAEGRYTTASGYASHAEGYGENVNNRTVASGDASHAEGRFTTASGKWSHAEGEKTKAIGLAAHAEGLQTTAEGQASHAEGRYTYAKGVQSHAEGYGKQDGSTGAFGAYSHSEGQYTTASGNKSHAEGTETNASADSAHAEGLRTTAGGMYSHAEGVGTQTKNNGEHAEGRFNKSNSVAPNEGSNPKNTLHSVGMGTSNTARKNAHEIMQDGKHYIFGIGGYDGTNSQTIGVKSVQQVINALKAENTELTDTVTVLGSRIAELENIISQITTKE